MQEADENYNDISICRSKRIHDVNEMAKKIADSREEGVSMTRSIDDSLYALWIGSRSLNRRLQNSFLIDRESSRLGLG
jgi:hypothetical protein